MRLAAYPAATRARDYATVTLNFARLSRALAPRSPAPSRRAEHARALVTSADTLLGRAGHAGARRTEQDIRSARLIEVQPASGRSVGAGRYRQPVTAPIVFIDTETTSLRPDRRAWEVGLIRREPGRPDAEHRWLIAADDLDLGNADSFALGVGRFYDRHPGYPPAEGSGCTPASYGTTSPASATSCAKSKAHPRRAPGRRGCQLRRRGARRPDARSRYLPVLALPPDRRRGARCRLPRPPRRGRLELRAAVEVRRPLSGSGRAGQPRGSAHRSRRRPVGTANMGCGDERALMLRRG